MEKEENRNQVEQAIEQQTGMKVRVSCVAKGTAASEPAQSSEWVAEVKAFFKGHEEKIAIDSKEEPQ